MTRIVVVLLSLVMAVQVFAAGEVGAPALAVRFSTSAESVRVVVDVPTTVAFTDKSTPKAAIVALDMPLAQAIPVMLITDPVATGVAVTPDEAGKALITVSLAKARKVKVFSLPAEVEKPFRVVIDILKRYAIEEKRALSPAISYTRLERQTDDGFLIAHLLDIDATDPQMRITVAAAAGERERVDAMAARLGAVAAVNGGYFLEGTRPVGLLKADGVVASLPLWGRTCAAFPAAGPPIFGNPRGAWRVTLPDGTVHDAADLLDASATPTPPDAVVVSGMNFAATPANADGLTVVVRDGKVAVRGTTPLPLNRRDFGLVLRGARATALDALLQPGAPMAVVPAVEPAWDAHPAAVGAGPRLLRDGKVDNTATAERFRSDIALGRPARTALGLTANGHVLLAAVEAPGPYGGGATLEELAGLLKAYGATDAMNLDGGGSTCMALGVDATGASIPPAAVTAPLGAWLRPVASGVLVFDGRVPPAAPPAPPKEVVVAPAE